MEFQTLERLGFIETRRAKVIPAGQACYRCSGAGGWKGWPGYTCFRCNGTGIDPNPVRARKVAKLQPLKSAAPIVVVWENARASCPACRRTDFVISIEQGNCCNPIDIPF